MCVCVCVCDNVLGALLQRNISPAYPNPHTWPSCLSHAPSSPCCLPPSLPPPLANEGLATTGLMLSWNSCALSCFEDFMRKPHTHTQTHRNTCVCTQTNISSHSNINRHTHITHTHPHALTHTHTQSHTYIHTHTHTTYTRRREGNRVRE